MEGWVLTLGTSGSALVFLGFWLLANGLGFICIFCCCFVYNIFTLGLPLVNFGHPLNFSENDRMCQFLGQEIVKWVSIVSGPRN